MEIPDGQPQQAAPGQVGEDQNGEANQLGNGGGQGGTGHAHGGKAEVTKDENGVQNAVDDAADAHAQHGKGGAALTAQALVHNEVAGHEGGGHQHIGGVVDGVLLAVGGGTQEPDHGGHKDRAENQKGGADTQGQEEGGGEDLAGFLVLTAAQKPGDVAVGAQGQHGAAHHNQLVQGGVDAHCRRGGGTQGTDKVGVGQGVDGVDQESHDGGHCHFEHQSGDGFVQHHGAPLLLTHGAFGHSKSPHNRFIMHNIPHFGE